MIGLTYFWSRAERISFYLIASLAPERDDYEKAYKVFLMPDLSNEDLAGSWDDLSIKAKRFLGEIPISDVEFDATRRKEVNLDILEKFGR